MPGFLALLGQRDAGSPKDDFDLAELISVTKILSNATTKTRIRVLIVRTTNLLRESEQRFQNHQNLGHLGHPTKLKFYFIIT